MTMPRIFDAILEPWLRKVSNAPRVAPAGNTARAPFLPNLYWFARFIFVVRRSNDVREPLRWRTCLFSCPAPSRVPDRSEDPCP